MKKSWSHGVELDFSMPRNPTDNVMVESFDVRLRQECLNEHWFLNMVDAQAVIEAWRHDYNTVRPHSALAGRTPDQFAQLSRGARRLSPPRPDGINPEKLTLSV